jgi:hypothetical protein
MLSSTLLLTAPIDQQVPAPVSSGALPFPVARARGEGVRDAHLHLVDGDGASLCEAFRHQQLELLPLAWHDVVTGARCLACQVIGSWSRRP